MSSLLCAQRVMDMTRTLQDQLVDKGLAKKTGQKVESKKKTEKLSKRDIEELMGIKRPTYRRNRGAFRQS